MSLACWLLVFFFFFVAPVATIFRNVMASSKRRVGPNGLPIEFVEKTLADVEWQYNYIYIYIYSFRTRKKKHIGILKAILCEESATISVVVLAPCRRGGLWHYFWLPNGRSDSTCPYIDARCSVKTERHVQLVYKLEPSVEERLHKLSNVMQAAN